MNPWRVGLLLAILAGTWSGWAWMVLVAAPGLRQNLLLLVGVLVLGTGATFWHARARLTPRLVTANLALGSVVHLAVASVVVGVDRLFALGVVPALASNWHHFVVGGLGVAAAFVTWTRARGTPEAPALRPLQAAPEPPPVPTPELAREPDWHALAAELAGRSDAARLRQLDALERVSTVLAGDGTPEERIAVATRVLRQAVLRLVAESEAQTTGADDEDVLSRAAALLEWGTQKLPELTELDVSDLLMAKAIADIRAMRSKVEQVFVDHRELRAIHPIDRATAEDKCNERAAAARAALPMLRANGMRLSEELIATKAELVAFKSVTGFQVVALDDGYVTFEGNGRREALQRAFGDQEGVQVEVRLYRFDDATTEAAIRRRVARVRHWKQVQD